ncbi:MAG TPA: glycogen-binding domain-containing protein [Gemmatimonadaceae bacterium]|nr:glycogen-binding domain-containing protein [Gemmatimonadaceae bacterium]
MTRARAAAFGGLLIALAVGRPLGAQDRAVLELGASYVRFPQDDDVVVGPSLRWTVSRERERLSLSGSLTGLVAAEGASGYADAASHWLVPLTGGWRGEIGGEVGALLASATPSSSSYASSSIASLRILRPIERGGIWLRGSGNLSTREAGALWGRGVDVGGWWRRSGVQLLASVTREWSVAQLFTGPGREGFVGVVPVDYIEGNLAARMARDAATLDVSAAARRDPGAEHLVESGFSATATVWRTPTQAFVLSAARQLPDFVRGAEASNSFTLGIRFNEPSPVLALAMRTPPTVQVAATEVDANGDSTRRTLRVRAPTAQSVEVRGDFTDWEPVALTLTGDVFIGSFVLSPGSHRLVLRVDGGDWRPAANTPAVDDDFGGRVGLLVVP